MEHRNPDGDPPKFNEYFRTEKNIMSTHAQVDIVNHNNKRYRFSIYRDGYPEGVVPGLPDEKQDLEEIRRALYLEDYPETMPDYYYVISLVDSTVEIYDADSSASPWKRGELIFSGTFSEAKRKYGN
uniref:Uncharacterized protein n=1 Tax=Candidatus Kentrum sp. LPFa TaxID=2126335 RepID=A0A450WH97_9GAMM|nr:MAG: hypothetical protein BECKLPF1236B_GA0070989_10947 [Candidatus Kentron sp. LPFa]